MDTLRALVAQEQLSIPFATSDSPTTDGGPWGLGSKRSKPSPWVAGLFLLIALGMGIGALVWFVNTAAFVGSAVTAPGHVIELERTKCGDKGANCYAPRVQFREAATGRQVEFVSSMSSNPPVFHVGEQVTVLYTPRRPETAMVQGLLSVWGGVILLFGLSIVFAIVGALILLFPYMFSRSSGDLSVSCDSPGVCSQDSSDFTSFSGYEHSGAFGDSGGSSDSSGA